MDLRFRKKHGEIKIEKYFRNANFGELEGNIGIICNGTGLVMATLDLVYQAGGKPASFVNIGGHPDYQNWILGLDRIH